MHACVQRGDAAGDGGREKGRRIGVSHVQMCVDGNVSHIKMNNELYKEEGFWG